MRISDWSSDVCSSDLLQRAVAAAKGVVAAQSLLPAPEVGQAVGIAPAAVAALPPAVEIHALAAVVEVAVDRAGAAQRLPARRPAPPPAGPPARPPVVKPITRRIAHGLHETGRAGAGIGRAAVG